LEGTLPFYPNPAGVYAKLRKDAACTNALSLFPEDQALIQLICTSAFLRLVAYNLPLREVPASAKVTPRINYATEI